MPHVITEPCIGTKDSSCVAVCPVDCIHPRKDESEFTPATQLYIDPDTCIDCGLGSIGFAVGKDIDPGSLWEWIPNAQRIHQQIQAAISKRKGA